jgi:hypothetical protein
MRSIWERCASGWRRILRIEPLWENSSRRSALHLVTNEQLYILVGLPMLFNATLLGLLIAYVNARLGRFEARFDAIDKRFDAIDRRFDDMRDLWRAELRRVEEVLDARLKHIEERG